MTLNESPYELARMKRAVSWHGGSCEKSMHCLLGKLVSEKESKTDQGSVRIEQISEGYIDSALDVTCLQTGSSLVGVGLLGCMMFQIFLVLVLHWF
jgi:hypothetical protein